MSSTDAIFLLGADGQLERVPYSTYATEAMLQELIANHPELLAGDQINREDPPRWLLVTREAGVPDAADTANRWSLDHLLLDHRAIPTFVEVKRSSDTRIRREVVGQMLDYAANATRHWPTDRIRSLAATQYGGIEELDRRVQELLDPAPSQEGSVDVEGYWTAVDDNLRSGTLRLLFVADELPRELRRLIEFLNEHMPKIEVLGVEVRHYAGKSLRVLVPRVIGQTERAREGRAPAPSRTKTTEGSFLEACPAWARSFFENVLSTARAKGLVISWATGFGIRATIKPVSILWCYPPGKMGIEAPFIDVFLKELKEYGLDTTLRENLRGLGEFRERGRGQYTIFLPLTEANLPQARAALPHIWEAYRQIQNSA